MDGSNNCGFKRLRADRLILHYLRYTRFEAKQFLLDAIRFMDGACPRGVIDNTRVMVAAGAGADALIAPEMAPFACTLGFEFCAHRVGDPDRKGRIERDFFWLFILYSSVWSSAGWLKASIGKPLRPIFATAPQFHFGVR